MGARSGAAMRLPDARADAALRHGRQALHPVGAARRHCTEPLWGGGSTEGCTCQMDDPSPRSCRELREPEGVKSSGCQPWHRRRQVARQHLREAAQRLARGFRLWEGALYEIGGRTPMPTRTSHLPHQPLHPCTPLGFLLCTRSWVTALWGLCRYSAGSPHFALGWSTLAHSTQPCDSQPG